MNCPQCSQPLVEGATTCSHCGATIAEPVAAQPAGPGTPAPTSTGSFPQQEEAPSVMDDLRKGVTDNPVAGFARKVMDDRKQRKEDERRAAEALAAAQAVARKQAFALLSKTCPMPLQEEHIDLPGGLELFNEEFVVTIGRDWGITTKKMILTTKRLIHVHGLLTKDQEVVDLVNVQDVEFTKSLLFPGQIEIETSGGHSITGLPHVKHGKEFRNQILALVNWAKSRPASVVVAAPDGTAQRAAQPSAAPAAPDKFEQLKKLADLKSAGVLSDAEFEAEKAKLLAGS
jgi:hypothetical protein